MAERADIDQLAAPDRSTFRRIVERAEAIIGTCDKKRRKRQSPPRRIFEARGLGQIDLSCGIGRRDKEGTQYPCLCGCRPMRDQLAGEAMDDTGPAASSSD